MPEYTLCLSYEDEFRITICKNVTMPDLPSEGHLVYLLENSKPLTVEYVSHHIAEERIEVTLTFEGIDEDDLIIVAKGPSDGETSDTELDEDPDDYLLDLIKALWNSGQGWYLHPSCVDDASLQEKFSQLVH